MLTANVTEFTSLVITADSESDFVVFDVTFIK